MTYIQNNRNFNPNRILLLTIGLWPFYRSKLVRLQIILLLSIVASFLVFQLTTFATNDCTFEHVIKISLNALYFIVFLLKYSSFWINLPNLKLLMEQLQQIYSELKDKNEIAIIEKYGCEAKRYTIKVTLITTCGVFTFIVLSFWPRLLSFFLFNESPSPRTMLIIAEYFIDQEKYFYLMILHMNAATCTGIIALIATGTIIATFLKHACGMFRIAGYRIEQAIITNVHKEINSEDEIIICRNIIYAVDIHRKAIEFCNFMLIKFEGSFFLLIFFGVICLSANLFRVFQLVLYKDSIEELLLYVLFANTIIFYMYLGNYAGQEITDHSNHIFNAAYNIQWYITPPHIQKLVLFLLQRSSKSYILNIGRVYTTSLERFAMLLSTSVSYCTVLYSTHK